MKTLFFEAKRKISGIDFSPLAAIKYKRIGLLASVQYADTIYNIKEALIKLGKEVFLSKALKYEGQILGCNVASAIAVKDKVDAFLIIGSGRFHAYNVASLGKPVFMWQPGSNVFEFPKEEILKINARKRANIIKFLSADAVGIIVSSKPGQCRLAEAMEFKKKLEKKRRKVFVFISDMISKNDLENFRIGAWINTACPRIVEDKHGIVNYTTVEKNL